MSTLAMYKCRLLYFTIYLKHIYILQKTVGIMMVEYIKMQIYLVYLSTQNSWRHKPVIMINTRLQTSHFILSDPKWPVIILNTFTRTVTSYYIVFYVIKELTDQQKHNVLQWSIMTAIVLCVYLWCHTVPHPPT